VRLPRFILNPSVLGWVRLYQRERRENQRLRAELREWQNRVLAQSHLPPLFTPPPPPPALTKQPIVGLAQKKAAIAEAARTDPNPIPTAEQILEAAAQRNGNR